MSLPKPYYQDSAVTIYHGDCQEILPKLPKVDLVLTDPPYGMSFRSNRRTVMHDRIAGDDALPLQAIELAVSMARNAAYVFCRWDNFYDMPKPRSVIAWVKDSWSMGDLKHEHGRQWEAVCFYPKDGHRFIKRTPDVISRARTNNSLHPTEKPVDLIAALLDANEGDMVLDPFMGSGTTLRAAKDLGRKAIGIELEEKYCEIAAKRMAQEVFDL